MGEIATQGDAVGDVAGVDHHAGDARHRDEVGDVHLEIDEVTGPVPGPQVQPLVAVGGGGHLGEGAAPGGGILVRQHAGGVQPAGQTGDGQAEHTLDRGGHVGGRAGGGVAHHEQLVAVGHQGAESFVGLAVARRHRQAPLGPGGAQAERGDHGGGQHGHRPHPHGAAAGGLVGAALRFGGGVVHRVEQRGGGRFQHGVGQFVEPGAATGVASVQLLGQCEPVVHGGGVPIERAAHALGEATVHAFELGVGGDELGPGGVEQGGVVGGGVVFVLAELVLSLVEHEPHHGGPHVAQVDGGVVLLDGPQLPGRHERGPDAHEQAHRDHVEHGGMAAEQLPGAVPRRERGAVRRVDARVVRVDLVHGAVVRRLPAADGTYAEVSALPSSTVRR
ncbi:MAG: hypothetical protein R2749_18890 [Acidimicrobiales bacterium]